MTDSFPQGIAALHPDWPEARFNVSGMFGYHPLILGLMWLVNKGFACRVPIEAIHGAPAVLWNGGRVAETAFRPAEVPSLLNALYTRSVGCFLTFSNHRLEAGDLADSTCNYLLDCIAQRPDLNGVIVNSELLSRYIAGKYPTLRQIASATKVTVEGGKGNAAYYRELGRRFFRYVVHPDDGVNLPLLDQLDRDKAEILVNENCLRDCPERPRHTDLIARSHRLYADNQIAAAGTLDSTAVLAEHQRFQQEAAQLATDCPSLPMDKQIGAKRRNCNLTRDELKAVYDLGFRSFKLQGRRDPVYVYAYDLTRYLLEPEVVAPLVYKTLCLKITFT